MNRKRISRILSVFIIASIFLVSTGIGYAATLGTVKSVSGTVKDGKHVSLKWGNVTGSDGYRIAIKVNGVWKYSKTKTTRFTIKNMAGKKPVKVYVQAFKVRNGKKSYGNKSSQVTVVIPKSLTTKVTSNENGSAKVSWSKDANVTGYKIYRSTKKDSGYKLVKTIKSPKTLSWTNNNLTNCKTYYYKVRGYKKCGEGVLYGKYSTAKRTCIPPKQLALEVFYQNHNEANVSWEKQKNVTGYKIYRSTSEGGTYTLVKTIEGADASNWVDKNLSSGKTYYYKARAYKSNSGTITYGKYSTIQSVKCSVAAIENVTLSTYDGNRVQVKWNATNADGVVISASVLSNGAVVEAFDAVKVTGNTWTTMPIKHNDVFHGQGFVRIEITPYVLNQGGQVYGEAKTLSHTFSNNLTGRVTKVDISVSGNQIRTSVERTNTAATARVDYYKNGVYIGRHDLAGSVVTRAECEPGTYYVVVTPVFEKDGFVYEGYSMQSTTIVVSKEGDPGLVSESEYLSKYTNTSKYTATPYYRYATRTKEYKQSGQSSLSSDNGNPWVLYDTKTTTSTSGYYFNSSYPSNTTTYTDTQKVTKSVVSKGKYYYGYSLKRNGDKAFFIDNTRANVISWAKANYSSSSVWAEENLYYLWYVGSEDSDRSSTMKKTVKSYTGSTVSPGTSSCMKTDGTATLGGEQKLYYYSRCYKYQTTTTTNYFERWSSWSGWGAWTTRESTSDYKKEDTTKMYYVVCN